MKQRAIHWCLIILISLVWLSDAALPAKSIIPITAVDRGIVDGPFSNHLASGISLAGFVRSLPRDEAARPVGVYVRDVLALKIQPQPASNPGYVTSSVGDVSLFRLAQEHGTTGLIAHNYLAGQRFFDLAEGQKVSLLFSDGTSKQYQVRSVRQLQALSPWSPSSNFRDLDQDGVVLTALQLFNQVYKGHGQVVFQTCIEVDGNPVWGRLFVIAEPLETNSSIHGMAKLP